MPIAVLEDVNVLSNPQNQQCADNSTQAKGDEPLSHILDDIPVLSGTASATTDAPQPEVLSAGGPEITLRTARPRFRGAARHGTAS